MQNKKAVIGVCALLVLGTGSVLADPPWKGDGEHGKGKPAKAQQHPGGGPPPWAPAHGYRAKQKGHYYEEPAVYERRSREFGIATGTCNRETLGTVLGGVVGGVVGSKVGDRDDRTVTTIAGVVVGALIGREIGKRMDRADQACTGQVLERAADHETVRWRNAQTGVEYLVTPERTFQRDDRYCRTYTTVALTGSERHSLRETACRNQDGAWASR